MLLHILAIPYSRIFFLLVSFIVCAVVGQARSNSAPVAIADSYTVHRTLTVLAPGVLVNDFDPDGDPIMVQNPSGGSVSATPHGTIITWSDGGFTYAPLFGYVGTDTFPYSICDTRGACSNSTTVTFNVTNQPPSASSESYTVHQTINFPEPGLLGNDSDPEGDPIHLDIPTGAGGGATPHGVIFSYGAGRFTYVAAIPYVGPDNYAYRVCDDLGACSPYTTANFNVVNQPPSVSSESYVVHTTPTIVPVEGELLANDADPEGDNPITLQNATGAGGGATPHGFIITYGNGGFTY